VRVARQPGVTILLAIPGEFTRVRWAADGWAIHAPQLRFDVRGEREEYERLFKHPARVLQDRLARRGRTDRTRQHAIPEWEKTYQKEAQERRLLYQARVLSWAKRRPIISRTRNLESQRIWQKLFARFFNVSVSASSQDTCAHRNCQHDGCNKENIIESGYDP
jgi:hypothetical protein